MGDNKEIKITIEIDGKQIDALTSIKELKDVSDYTGLDALRLLFHQMLKEINEES